MITKNLPLLLNLSYYGYNRGLGEGDFVPKPDGTTYCNRFISYVANGYGYQEFDGMTANEMHLFMKDPKNGWMEIPDDAVIQSHANAGVLCLASWANPEGHGHVCLILPGILEKSSTWGGRSVPKVANIGKDVFYGKKLSFAFTLQSPPTFFAYSKMI